ncbi:hypothetical protein [Pseudaquabacterium terrae]|nr:hypothetical protein [Aquabacterium terrae]
MQQKKIPLGWRLQVAASRLARTGGRWLAPRKTTLPRRGNRLVA